MLGVLLELLEPVVEAPAERAGGLDEVGVGRDVHRLVDGVLDMLPPEQRIVLAMSDIEEMAGREIAEVLALPHPTVRSRLRLARDRLRGHVDELSRNPAELESTLHGLERWAAELRQQLA